MATEEIMYYFRDFEPKAVEWINDSCCNVICHDDKAAARAVVTLGDPMRVDVSPPVSIHQLGCIPGNTVPFPAMQEGGLSEIDPSDLEALAWHWHKGKESIEKDGAIFTLQFRIATVEDKKKLAEPKRSRFLWKQGEGGGRMGAQGGVDKRGRGRGRGPEQDLRRELQKKRGSQRTGAFSYEEYIAEVVAGFEQEQAETSVNPGAAVGAEDYAEL